MALSSHSCFLDYTLAVPTHQLGVWAPAGSSRVVIGQVLLLSVLCDRELRRRRAQIFWRPFRFTVHDSEAIWIQGSKYSKQTT